VKSIELADGISAEQASLTFHNLFEQHKPEETEDLSIKQRKYYP